MIALAGKTVAIVGNARSLLDRRHGDRIDSHDVVVRMNRGVPEDPPSQGMRTDMLCFSTYKIIDGHVERFGAVSLVWMSPKYRGDLPGYDGDYYDLALWAALQQRLGARPSVGAMVLDMVSAMAPATVTVFGMDFKRTPTTYSAEPWLGQHDYRAEEAFCEALVAERGWTLVRDYTAGEGQAEGQA